MRGKLARRPPDKERCRRFAPLLRVRRMLQRLNSTQTDFDRAKLAFCAGAAIDRGVLAARGGQTGGETRFPEVS